MPLLPLGEKGKPSWKPYANQIADETTIDKWVAAADAGELQAIAVVAGQVSGGLCVLDFDVPSFFDAWMEKVWAISELFDVLYGLPMQVTGGGGHQVFFRCANPGGNGKLAWALDAADPTGRTIAIETRGENGYAVVPPSLHPSGGHYVMSNASLGDVPHIDQAIADRLIQLARDLDEAPFTCQQMAHLDTQARTEHRQRRNSNPSGSLIAAYNEKHSVEELLLANGYTRGTGERFIRPGGVSESVSVSDGRSVHFSTNDPLNDGSVKDGIGVHDAFDIFTHFTHSGDKHAAVKALVGEFPDIAASIQKDAPITVEVGASASPVTIQIEKDGGRKPSVKALRDNKILHADKIDFDSALSRQRFANAVASKVCGEGGADPNDSAKTLAGRIEDALLNRIEEVRTAPNTPATADEPDHAALLAAMPEAVRSDAEKMLLDPQLMDRICHDIEALGAAGENDLLATLYIVGTSRLLPTPLSARIHGHTSSGKSYLLDCALKLIPPEGIIRATAMTPQALYHMASGSLRHRCVAGGERSRMENDETAEATRALREMIASGRLSKLMPVKIGNEIVSKLIEQEGPIAFFETTSLSKVFDEDANRCLTLSTDEREEQTRRIITAQAHAVAHPPADVAAIIARHHAIQRMLAVLPAKVTIPFGEILADQFPSKRPEARRAFPQVLSMIQAVALLFHRQRTIGDKGIIATAQDYLLARNMLQGPMARAIGGGVSAGARRFWPRLIRRVGTGSFNTTAAAQGENFTEKSVRGWLLELSQARLLTIVEEGGRGRSHVFQVAQAVPGCAEELDVSFPDPMVLPSVEEVCGD